MRIAAADDVGVEAARFIRYAFYRVTLAKYSQTGNIDACGAQ